MQTQLLFLDKVSAADYYVGEREGRKDGARGYGMQDTRNMNERQAMGYRDGYYSTRGL